MSSRPRIKLVPEPLDRLLDVGGIALLCMLWVMVYFSYQNMPDTIATHFDGGGNADGFGNKSMMFIAPVVATITFFLLFFINKAPHLFNYNVTITDENAPTYYRLATRMIRLMNICMLIAFFAVAYTMMNGGSSPIVIIVAVSLPILPVIWYFVQSAKLKKNS